MCLRREWNIRRPNVSTIRSLEIEPSLRGSNDAVLTSIKIPATKLPGDFRNNSFHMITACGIGIIFPSSSSSKEYTCGRGLNYQYLFVGYRL
ncbi:113_t:CDS:2 [Funneliformis caledonium]|uniref:113_t:CDS:1 n=1 Tax=Funneliformis caledonium TaxID=1117310 RepID=A0A9N9AKH5_9GLOM|nr:113_t:CDS:2 [Funneliformis caledonium]